MWDAVGTDGCYASWGVVAVVWAAGAMAGGRQRGGARDGGRQHGATGTGGKQRGGAGTSGEEHGAAGTGGKQRGGAGASGEEHGAARRGGRDVASLVAAGVAVVILLSPARVWQALTVGAPWVRVAGLVVLAGATAWTVRARVALGSMWSSGAVARRDHVLRTSGPYRVTRHPVYTGILGMLAGSALAQGLGRWVVLAAVVGLLLLVKARTEERLLAAEFPAEYARYRREVPRVIPRIRPGQGGTGHDGSGQYRPGS